MLLSKEKKKKIKAPKVQKKTASAPSVAACGSVSGRRGGESRLPEAERGLAAEAAEGRPGPGPDPAGAAAGQQPPGGPRDRRPRRAEATEAPTPQSRSGVIRRGTKLDLQASDHGGLLTRETSRPHPPRSAEPPAPPATRPSASAGTGTAVPAAAAVVPLLPPGTERSRSLGGGRACCQGTPQPAPPEAAGGRRPRCPSRPEVTAAAPTPPVPRPPPQPRTGRRRCRPRGSPWRRREGRPRLQELREGRPEPRAGGAAVPRRGRQPQPPRMV